MSGSPAPCVQKTFRLGKAPQQPKEEVPWTQTFITPPLNLPRFLKKNAGLTPAFPPPPTQSLRAVKMRSQDTTRSAAPGGRPSPPVSDSSADASRARSAIGVPDSDRTGAVTGEAAGSVSAPELRAYAHCARWTTDSLNTWGGVVLLLLNTAATTTQLVDVWLPTRGGGRGEADPATGAGPPTSPLPAEFGHPAGRLDYLLTPTPAGLRAPAIALNGVTLRAAADGSIPPMPPVHANGSVVELPPLSFGFFVFPSAGARACLTPAQLAREKRSGAASEGREAGRRAGARTAGTRNARRARGA